jgi:hypothetical protein
MRRGKLDITYIATRDALMRDALMRDALMRDALMRDALMRDAFIRDTRGSAMSNAWCVARAAPNADA